MTCDKVRFLTLKKEIDWSVYFGNENLAKIIERDKINIGSKDTKEGNVLLVEDMKQNILSVIQMCDQGHKLVFDSQKCDIIKAYSRRVVVIDVRTTSNIYVLSEIRKEKCCLGKED
jgi:hypothetical protein